MVGLKESAGQAPAQLRSLLSSFRKLRADSDVASFRAQTRSAIDDMVRKETITATESEQLVAIREAVIEWRTKSGLTLSAAFPQWLARWHSTSEDAQRGVLQDLLGCLPRGTLEEQLWWPIISGEDRRLREAIIDAKLVRSADLTKLAKARPSEFLSSPAPEALIDMEVPVPRVVWEKSYPARVYSTRPSAFEEGLADSYSLDLAHDSSAWLIEFLADRPEVRARVIQQLLREPASILRLIRASAGHGVAANGKRAKRASTTIDPLLADVVAVCSDAMGRKRPTAATAERCLYLLRQLIASEPPNYTDEVKAAVDAAVRPAIASELASLLRRAQTSKDPARDTNLTRHVLPVRGDELAEVVGAFMTDLSANAAAGQASHHAGLERYQAVRELVEDVLPLLDAPRGTDLTGSLRTALLNAGLSPVGTVDERCAFDPVIHEPGSTDPTVGDVVQITESGWQIGQERSAIVLRKALVELVASASSSVP